MLHLYDNTITSPTPGQKGTVRDYDVSMTFFVKSNGGSLHKGNCTIDANEILCKRGGEWKLGFSVPRDELEGKNNLVIAMLCPGCQNIVHLVRGLYYGMDLQDIIKLESKRRDDHSTPPEGEEA